MKAFIAVVRNRFGSLVVVSAKAVGVGATEPTVYNSEVLQAFFPRGKQEENVLATRELIQRQVGGTHMESIFVTKQNCNHGYPQVICIHSSYSLDYNLAVWFLNELAVIQ